MNYDFIDPRSPSCKRSPFLKEKLKEKELNNKKEIDPRSPSCKRSPFLKEKLKEKEKLNNFKKKLKNNQIKNNEEMIEVLISPILLKHRKKIQKRKNLLDKNVLKDSTNQLSPIPIKRKRRNSSNNMNFNEKENIIPISQKKR